MIKSIKAADLKIGMYIMLPHAWKAHPFLRNSFLLESERQIQKIINYGIESVNVEMDKSEIVDNTPPMVYQEYLAQQQEKQKKINTDDIKEIINDKKMTPQTKAETVHWQSVDMMSNLFHNPTAENIAEVKQGVGGIVDLILRDNDTEHYLLRLNSHDYDTYIHSVNVGMLSLSLAKVVLEKKDKHDMHALGAGFFLHDIGKVNIEDTIIKKPGKLTEEEWALMRKHPGMGFKLLNDCKQISEESRLIVLQHHERDNGMGYPKKMKGNEIHIYGRICSVADVFDALASKRPYKQMLKPFEALKVMKEEMLDHFQKEIFEQFVLLLK